MFGAELQRVSEWHLAQTEEACGLQSSALGSGTAPWNDIPMRLPCRTPSCCSFCLLCNTGCGNNTLCVGNWMSGVPGHTVADKTSLYTFCALVLGRQGAPCYFMTCMDSSSLSIFIQILNFLFCLMCKCYPSAT